MKVAKFIADWQDSGGNERRNAPVFLTDLCDALEVPRPDFSGKRDAADYVLERDVRAPRPGGKSAVERIDLYKDGCFALEAKQGSDKTHAKIGTAARGTRLWSMAMEQAAAQARGYVQFLPEPPPFIIAVDIGYCFDIYASFDGSLAYRPYAGAARIFLKDLATHRDLLRAIFLEPQTLNPALARAALTRSVAEKLAEIAKSLEKKKGNSPAVVHGFLMRCVFTMFAESVNLLPSEAFSEQLEKKWIKRPETFPAAITQLWHAMNAGLEFGFLGKLLHFNGGLFREPTALALSKDELKELLAAARCRWHDVEPAIFGTLVERALDKNERHKLGAHFTPRSYVEKLVRCTIEEPLRREWDEIREQVLRLVERNRYAPAKVAVRSFLLRLSGVRVLDPACGSGNFLYVALDVLKTLEAEVLSFLSALEQEQPQLGTALPEVSPKQFLGIELNDRAKEIAELVLWIGYLQWHFRARGRDATPPEPVLQDYKNITPGDAVLAWDGEPTPRRDEFGQLVTRWDGASIMISPVTGRSVPDESSQVSDYTYINSREADWPAADFVIGNPPFLGNKRMKAVLGPGYVEALREAHDDVPESADLVMYWWNKAARLVEEGKLLRFGLITTNSITQGFNKRVVEAHVGAGKKGALAFAIPDHPWVDSKDGAQVRIAMTVLAADQSPGRLQEVRMESEGEDGKRVVELTERHGLINADLTIGANLSGIAKLRSNRGLSCPGVQLSGQGFVLSLPERKKLSAPTRDAIVRPYLTGRDLSQVAREQFVIDTFGLTEQALRTRFPDAYQWLLDRVKPQREQNPRASYAKSWWLHSEPRAKFRGALTGLHRFIVTSRTARHRVFQFLPAKALPETKVLIIALDDAALLGVLSSRVHLHFASATGGWLGVGNDLTYNHSSCFDTFPFPEWSDASRQRVAAIMEELDAHRKSRQATSDALTITAMYNALDKLRSGEPMVSEHDRMIHEVGLVSVLKKLHDELDSAVFDAYGWPRDLADDQILSRLVALNAQRAQEETMGLVRWLRPKRQRVPTQIAHPDLLAGGAQAIGPWPKRQAEQVREIKKLRRTLGGAVTAEQVAARYEGADPAQVEETLATMAETERPSSRPPPAITELPGLATARRAAGQPAKAKPRKGPKTAKSYPERPRVEERLASAAERTRSSRPPRPR